MSLRPLVLLSLFSLLVACSSDAPKPQPPTPGPHRKQAQKKAKESADLGPLPAYQRELSGTLQGVPAGAEVELALLVIDDKDRPQQLLASSSLIGTNQILPFHLRFNPESFPGWRPGPAPEQAQKKARESANLGPLPAYQRELSGTLQGVPTGAEVELALLVIDDKDRPQQLLASSSLIGNNQVLPFHLRFNPDSFPAGARVELRGRASQSGQLILHLPSQAHYPANDPGAGSAAIRQSAMIAPLDLQQALGELLGDAQTGCLCVAGHRTEAVADRRRQHGPRLQPGRNPADSA